MSDHIIASTYNYTVTSSRVEIADKTYFTSNITSIFIKSTHIKEQKKTVGEVKVGERGRANIGCFGSIASAALLLALPKFTPIYETSPTLLWIAVATFSILTIFLMNMYISTLKSKEIVTAPAQTKYEVLLDTNSGRITAYVTFDGADARGLKAAIEEAVGMG